MLLHACMYVLRPMGSFSLEGSLSFRVLDSFITSYRDCCWVCFHSDRPYHWPVEGGGAEQNLGARGVHLSSLER